eukprot:COSAG05_NODE_23594_length_257_cov_0.594937_1_plen_61_part_10
MSSDAAGAEEKAPEEVCPACKGTLAATGLVFASCASKHFFKQKTAYEILRSDWSSDVCSSD